MKRFHNHNYCPGYYSKILHIIFSPAVKKVCSTRWSHLKAMIASGKLAILVGLAGVIAWQTFCGGEAVATPARSVPQMPAVGSVGTGDWNSFCVQEIAQVPWNKSGSSSGDEVPDSSSSSSSSSSSGVSSSGEENGSNVSPASNSTSTSPSVNSSSNSSSSPVPLDDASVKEQIEKARVQVNAGNLAEARLILKQAIRSNPMNIQLLIEYHPVCVKSNDWSDAVMTLEKIFKLEPAKEKDFYAAYGESLYKLRRLDKAQIAFNKALDFGKDKELIHRTLVEIAKQQKNDLMAESEYAEYLKLKPNDGDMQFEYANILYKLKKTKEAVAHYKLASQLKPNDAYIQEKLAFLLLAEKDYAGSIAAYRRAIQADPRNSARLAAALKFARAQQKAAGQGSQPAK